MGNRHVFPKKTIKILSNHKTFSVVGILAALKTVSLMNMNVIPRFLINKSKVLVSEISYRKYNVNRPKSFSMDHAMQKLLKLK